jgi:hypothetical protein
MHHDLKSQDPHFGNLQKGIKPFEIRRDDRNFQAGDTVTYQHYWPNGIYSGEEVGPFRIGLVVRHKNFPEGIKPGFCVYAHTLVNTTRELT